MCKLGVLPLPDYVAKVPVCISQDNAVIVATSRTTLTRYHLSDMRYQKLHDVDMSVTMQITPERGFRIHSAPGTGYVIREWEKKERLPTYVYDENLCLKNKFEDSVGLLLTVTRDKLVYQEEVVEQVGKTLCGVLPPQCHRGP